MDLIRLNQFLAQGGVASRRKADELIIQGRVQVNGQLMTELGTKIEKNIDKVMVDGHRVTAESKLVYYAVYKPVGVVSSTANQNQETPITSLVPKRPRVFPVGRLDKNSEGLIVLTNDGALAYKLTHPKFELIKKYEVWVDRQPTHAEIEILSKGVKLKEGMTAESEWRVINSQKLEVKIHQGWNRQIRRMLAKFEITVRRLVRTAVGPISLGPLKSGEYRRLTEAEISRIL